MKQREYKKESIKLAVVWFELEAKKYNNSCLILPSKLHVILKTVAHVMNLYYVA